ncbi:hypothetical protein HanPSC8_Chr01g0041771 [Helianthus annuus]|nr:hypothetical protein HanPSC8_Chr01g0041771 [Helianthus annuus]
MLRWLKIGCWSTVVKIDYSQSWTTVQTVQELKIQKSQDQAVRNQGSQKSKWVDWMEQKWEDLLKVDSKMKIFSIHVCVYFIVYMGCIVFKYYD